MYRFARPQGSPHVPRLTKKLPSYRRHKISGQAIVTLDGRDHYLGDFGSPASKAEYDRLIVAWLDRGRRPAAPPDDRRLT
jgi:hypothetical protein